MKRSVDNASDNKAVISFQGNSVIYSEQETEVWRMDLSSVVIVGEYTTANGPYIDDYFFVFVTRPEGHHFHASFYAEGRENLLAALSQHFNFQIQCGLCDSTELTSRCIWPPHLLNQRLFRFTKGPAGGGWSRIRRLISPEYAFDFTSEVEAYLSSLGVVAEK